VLAPLALMGAIFYLSAQPAGAELAWWEVAIRKLGHFGGYAALTLLWSWALSPRLGRRAIPVALGISILYAVGDEYHQSLVDGRHGTPRDVAIDALGGVGGAVVATWLRHKSAEAAPAHPKHRRRTADAK
jgi:VanZ family protein